MVARLQKRNSFGPIGTREQRQGPSRQLDSQNVGGEVSQGRNTDFAGQLPLSSESRRIGVASGGQDQTATILGEGGGTHLEHRVGGRPGDRHQERGEQEECERAGWGDPGLRTQTVA